MRRLTLPLALSLLFLGSTARALAQGSGDGPPLATAETETFTSLDGRFTIALPSTVSAYRPLNAPTPVGQIEGQTFVWSTARGRFSVSYLDYPKQFAASSKTLLDEMRGDLLDIATKSQGKFKGEREMSISGHAGREMRADFTDGSLLAWAFFEQDRLYKLTATIPNSEPEREAEARRVLASFRLLSTEEIEAARHKMVAAAEPVPLPQSPVAKKLTTDAADDGLKGKVKAVMTEAESLSGTEPTGRSKPSSAAYYDGHGNLTKRSSFDYRGNLSNITVYGYLDGQRASHSKTIRHEYDPPAPLAAASAAQTTPRDARYTYKFTHKYDRRGRLAEKLLYGNDGKLRSREVYSYADKRKEWLVYNPDGSLHQKYAYALERDGNIVEETFFERDMMTPVDTFRYTYEFDRHGNWTKRVSLKQQRKDGQAEYVPVYAHYRIITYY
jgi:hypothetical protein